MEIPEQSPRFATTRWTMVLAARGADDPSGRKAMEALCRAYWYPLYAYVRRSGYSSEDARDLTQAFFERLLEKNFLRLVTPEKGHFRSFLMMAMKRFLVGEWRKGRAAKRGGGAVPLVIQGGEAEERYAAEPLDTESPEILFDRRWALTLLERALGRLRLAYESTGRVEVYEKLKEFLTGDSGEATLAERAREAGMSESAARVAVHRMRKRFRAAFREELAETVTEERFEQELEHLLKILSE